MKLLSYRLGAERIAWDRARRLDAMRDAILTAVYRKLLPLKPNTALNIRHPWKLSERHAMRAWCPRHNGQWVKLIVRADEDGHVAFECAAGCSQKQVRAYIVNRDDETSTQILPASSSQPAMGAGTHRKNDRGLTTVLDARHRFQCHTKKGGGVRSSGGCGDAA
jgi:hypothetical protein